MGVSTQIELYPEPLAEPDDGNPTGSDADPTTTTWGWRKVVETVPREVLEDSGAVFATREDALEDARSKFPTWPIG